MKYRSEWKYICNNHDLVILEERIKGILCYDQNAGKKTYNIHSLYFDDYLNSCANDNDAGASERLKWRIRYYDDDRGFIRLEKKEKNNDLCYKRSCVISRKEYDDIIKGNTYDVFWNTQEKLLKEFCLEIIRKLYAPKIIIDYERTAFVEPITNIRITFDKNICGSLNINEFLEGTYEKYPLQNMGQHVLEVKFDDVLPSYLEKILHENGLQRNTFSKYYLGRIVLERNIL